MARKRKTVVSAFNVRLHDFDKHSYSDLINFLFDMKRSIDVRGDNALLIKSLESKEDDLSGDGKTSYTGEIIRYTKIDDSGQWFNSETLATATDGDLRQVRIPDYLHPNMNAYSYIFFPEVHLLIVQTYGSFGSISPKTIKSFLERLCRDGRVVDRFGAIEIDIVSDASDLEKLFDIEVVKKINIFISRPNADHWPDDLDEEIQQRLREQNAKEERQEIIAAPGQSIEPNDRTKNYSRVATRNGKVIVEGREAGVRVTRSTEQFPLEVSEKYAPDLVSEAQAVVVAAARALRSFLAL